MAFEAALAHREAGLLRMARGRKGDRERAEASLKSARALFLEVGAQRLVAEVDGLLAASEGTACSSPRGTSLSGREREVAELVAAGLSNRQIARRLVISEKTAAHHVGSILNKLGFGTRAEIAAYVARQPVTPEIDRLSIGRSPDAHAVTSAYPEPNATTSTAAQGVPAWTPCSTSFPITRLPTSAGRSSSWTG